MKLLLKLVHSLWFVALLALFGLSSGPSTFWITASALAYNRNYPDGSLLKWLATAPTPQSGAAVVGLTAGSAAQSSWLTPSSSVTLSPWANQSSSTGK